MEEPPGLGASGVGSAAFESRTEIAHVLRDFEVHPSLATADLGKAKDWYAEKLGLSPIAEYPTLAFSRVGTSMFTVYETKNAGTAQNTVAIWLVDDLRAEVARLRGRGLVFEDLDYGPDDRTIDGIMTSPDAVTGGTVLNAWFRDADGNWISMVEQGAHPGEEPEDAPAIGVMLAASDLGRARAWYADKLGLEPAHDVPDEIVYRQGKTHFTVYQTDAAGTARNTVAVWRIGDLRAEMSELRARGAVFEDYDFGEIRTVDGVLADPDGDSLSAWFKDSEGNVLGLVQDLRPIPGMP
jgi:catechol 2,3-dioxygenase-like lactoylglutathione lyase family enzyme